MKILSEVLDNTLTTAKQITNLPAELQYSLTKNDGKMIMEIAKNRAEDNDKNLVAILKSTLKLPLNINRKTIFTEYGTEFIDEVEVGELTKEQKVIAEQVIDNFYKPMTALEITKEIARLQMIAPEREKTDVDIKARTAIWIEELLKYPSDIVIQAFRRKYRWFPTLAEILDICDNEVAFRNLLKMKIRCSRNYL